MEQQTGSKLGKEYIKAVYCHLAYLTYMQSSVQLSHSVMSGSLLSHGLQHARPPCTSPFPEFKQTHVHLNFCHPLLLLPSIFPTSGSFQMSQFFTSGGQSILHLMKCWAG